jgi:hypothetical protein
MTPYRSAGKVFVRIGEGVCGWVYTRFWKPAGFFALAGAPES